MYSLNIPVSVIRTKIRQEFEKHRYVKQLSVIDVLLFQCNTEFQVCRLHLSIYLLGLAGLLTKTNRKRSTSGSSWRM